MELDDVSKHNKRIMLAAAAQPRYRIYMRLKKSTCTSSQQNYDTFILDRGKHIELGRVVEVLNGYEDEKKVNCSVAADLDRLEDLIEDTAIDNSHEINRATSALDALRKRIDK